MAESVQRKRCRACGAEKPLSDYFKSSSGNAGGLQTICKTCSVENTKDWRDKNRARANEYSKKWKEKNLEKVRELARMWREKNREKAREHSRMWYEKHSATPEGLQRLSEMAKRSQATSRLSLADSYLKTRLVQGTDIRKDQLPHDLIEAKRQHLKLKRLLKEKQK